MTTRAAGTFEVKLSKQPLADTGADPTLGRMSIDKKFSGDLQATGKGEMLMAGSPATGSAGYVAIERVEGTLHGRRGAFALQHSATMHGGGQQLAIAVVPDSGTGELAGLSGSLAVDIVDGKHLYTFDYTLAKSPSA